MRYSNLEQAASYPYPQQDIDPLKKDSKWCMQYAKAAYFDFNYSYPKGMFANNGGDYQRNRMYALGKQPINQYKKLLGVDEQTNNTWLSIDWTVRPIVSKYRDMAISRLMKQQSDIIATPIDILAKSELDEYYANMKAKLALRKLLEQVNNADLSKHPIVLAEKGEPMDIEELEMRVDLGEQFNRSKDAELAIAVGFNENNYTRFRRRLYEDGFDCGVGGYKEWLGADGKAKFRRVDCEAVVINFCREPNFSDMVHAGEIIDVSLIDLATKTDENGNLMFTEEQLQEFAGSIAGKWGNPGVAWSGTWLKPYDKFKCKVLDIEFYSYNMYTFTDRTTKEGNAVFYKEEYNRGKDDNPRYKRKKIKVVYKCKWIVGTDYCYDWGLATDMKRASDPEKLAETKLSYSFFAFNFYEMKAQGMMERLIPYLDDYQLTILKIQNFKNRAVPSGWWIDLDALEDVAMNKGGKNMEPKELLQMFFETGVLVGRSKTESGEPQSPNWKPVIPIENTAASELDMFYQDLVTTISQIESITGYNAITTGDPNPKTLVPGYQMANMSTNDALYPLAFMEEQLSTSLAQDVLTRMKQGLQKGKVSGYAKALNTNVLQFVELSDSICMRDYGVILEQRPSDDQKMWLLQMMQADIGNGFLDSSDAILILNSFNAKQAQAIWSYRVKKAKEMAHARKMEELQATNQANLQMQQMSGQQKMQETMMMYQFEIQKQRDQITGELQKKKMEVDSQERIALQKNQTAMAEQQLENTGKETVAQITAESKVVSTAVASEGAKDKQKIANEKPQPKSSSKK